MSVPPRALSAEWMDEPDADPAQLARSLGDLRHVNRWLGGTRAVLHHLSGMLRRLPPGEYRVLDVATGSADIPRALTRQMRGGRHSLRVVALDFHAATLQVARDRTRHDPAISVVQADALSLPFAAGAFHFALCSTALHHFERARAVRVLRELGRVAMLGVVVTDLRRSRAALLGAKLLASTVWRRSPMTRHDGPLSVKGAFTAAEMRAMAEAAGLEAAKVTHHPMFRVALVVDRIDAAVGVPRSAAGE